MKPKCVQCVYGRNGHCINCGHLAPWLSRRGFISMIGAGLIVAALPEIIKPKSVMVVYVRPMSAFELIVRPGVEAEFEKIYARHHAEWDEVMFYGFGERSS